MLALCTERQKILKCVFDLNVVRLIIQTASLVLIVSAYAKFVFSVFFLFCLYDHNYRHHHIGSNTGTRGGGGSNSGSGSGL